MSAIASRSLRLACDLGSPDAALDPRTNLPPSLLRGADLLLQLAAFRDGAIADDVSNYDTITAILRAVDASGALGAVVATAAINGAALTACDAAAWRAGAGQHAVIALDGGDLNVAAGRYRLIVYGITGAGVLVPWAHCPLSVLDVGLVDGVAPSPAGDFYTKAEADALFILAGAGDAAFRVSPSGEFIQLKDATTGLWRSIWFDNGVLQHGPGES